MESMIETWVNVEDNAEIIYAIVDQYLEILDQI